MEDIFSKLSQVTELIKDALEILNDVCLPQAQPNAKLTAAPLEYLFDKRMLQIQALHFYTILPLYLR